MEKNELMIKELCRQKKIRTVTVAITPQICVPINKLILGNIITPPIRKIISLFEQI